MIHTTAQHHVAHWTIGFSDTPRISLRYNESQMTQKRQWEGNPPPLEEQTFINPSTFVRWVVEEKSTGPSWNENGSNFVKSRRAGKIELCLCLTCFEYLRKLYEALRKSAPRSVSSEYLRKLYEALRKSAPRSVSSEHCARLSGIIRGSK